jgi:transcriptional regulatory protein AMDR
MKGFPCSNCISSHRPNCRIHEKKRRAISRPSGTPIPILSRSPTVPIASGTVTQTPPSPDVEMVSSNLEYQSDIHLFYDKPDDDLLRVVYQNDLGQRAIHRGVRVTYVGKDVSNINFLVRQRHQGGNDDVYHYPSDKIARKYLQYEPGRIPRDAFVLPDQTLADELVDAYFTHVNRGCPLVDEEIFMAQYGGTDPTDPPSLLLLQTILLVGAHVSKPRPERDTLKAAFFRRAKMLFDSRVEWNRDYVVQAALLMTWHSDGVEDVVANAWYWVGVAARIATGL